MIFNWSFIPSCSVVTIAATVAVVAKPIKIDPEAVRGASGHPIAGKNKDEKHEHTKDQWTTKRISHNHQITTMIY